MTLLSLLVINSYIQINTIYRISLRFLEMHQLDFLIRIRSPRVCGSDSQPLSKPSSERSGKAIHQGNSFASFLGRERTLTFMGPPVSQTLCLGG